MSEMSTYDVASNSISDLVASTIHKSLIEHGWMVLVTSSSEI